MEDVKGERSVIFKVYDTIPGLLNSVGVCNVRLVIYLFVLSVCC